MAKYTVIYCLVPFTIWVILMLSALFLLLTGLHAVTPVQAPDRATPTLRCLPREELLVRIKKDDAKPLFVGLSTSGVGLEVWHNPDDLWIAFFSRPDGLACIVSQGVQMGFADSLAKVPDETD